jgi:hypothetical protein
MSFKSYAAAGLVAVSAFAGPAAAQESFVKLTPPVVLDDQMFFHPVRPNRGVASPSPGIVRPSITALTCAGGRTLVRGRGYTRVVARDCSGDFYRYSGFRNGVRYDIRVRSGTGRILSVRPGA